MTRLQGPCLLAALLVGCALPLRAGEMKATLDSAANVKLLKTRFDRYPSPAPALQFEPQGLRFQFDTYIKKPLQTGISSTFAVAGDFEISALYEWTPVIVPKEGYGVSCALAVDADAWTVALARGNFPGSGSAYVITRGLLQDGKKTYKNETPIPTQAKRGKLVLRREKKEIICLTADGDEELVERGRLALTAETVRKVHFYADPGNAPTNLDARLQQIRVRAEEITNNIPLHESSGGGWWMALAAGVLAAAAALIGMRAWQGRWLWSRDELETPK